MGDSIFIQNKNLLHIVWKILKGMITFQKVWVKGKSRIIWPSNKFCLSDWSLSLPPQVYIFYLVEVKILDFHFQLLLSCIIIAFMLTFLICVFYNFNICSSVSPLPDCAPGLSMRVEIVFVILVQWAFIYLMFLLLYYSYV